MFFFSLFAFSLVSLGILPRFAIWKYYKGFSFMQPWMLSSVRIQIPTTRHSVITEKIDLLLDVPLPQFHSVHFSQRSDQNNEVIKYPSSSQFKHKYNKLGLPIPNEQFQ